MSRRPEGSARDRRLQVAQLRLCNQKIVELESQLAGLQVEMTAAIYYLRAHESRLVAQRSRLEAFEVRLGGHEGELQRLHEATQNIISSNLWKRAGRMGHFARKLTGRK